MVIPIGTHLYTSGERGYNARTASHKQRCLFGQEDPLEVGMEGRFPTGIFIVFSRCNDPAKERDLNLWYNNIHIPDVTQKGIFGNATRYLNPRSKGTDSDPNWFAVYETDRGDIERAWQENTEGASSW
ncbi:hypothetical protein M1O29_04090, partial [Dehalococcoidia bacterium]|nr:hypothetical protein [Dehalococcoidia bacterium]